MKAWIPISVRLPFSSHTCIVAGDDGGVGCAQWFGDCWDFYSIDFPAKGNFTHWMPMLDHPNTDFADWKPMELASMPPLKVPVLMARTDGKVGPAYRDATGDISTYADDFPGDNEGDADDEEFTHWVNLPDHPYLPTIYRR